LIYLAVTKAAGYDFRAGCYFIVALLSATAAAMILVARRLRGRQAHSDAFFPLITLNWGQADNLLVSYEIVFVLAFAVMAALLLIIVQPGRLSFRAAMALAGCTLLLPLCGGPGLAFVPACATCVGLVGWQLHQERKGTKEAVWIWTLALLAVGLTGFYFVNYSRPAKVPVSHNLLTTMNATVQFLVTGLGSIVSRVWPYIAVAFYASCIALGWSLFKVWSSRPEERPRLLRLCLFFGGIACLAGGVAWARGTWYPGAMFASRYATLAAIFWCATYLAWEAIDRPAVRRTAQNLLFVLSALLLLPNAKVGTSVGAAWHKRRMDVVNEIRQGVSLDQIVARHTYEIYYGNDFAVAADRPAGPDTLKERLKMLKESEVGVFRSLNE
jgi:hypothetical protein